MGAQIQTNSNRLSLNSSVLAGRIKKFDTYDHKPAESQRANPRQSSRVRPVQPVQQKPLQQPQASRVRPASISTQPSKPAAMQQRRPQRTVMRAPTTQSSVNIGMQDTQSGTHQLAMHAVKQSARNQRSVLADQFEDARYLESTAEKPKKSKLVFAMNTVAIVVFLFAGAVSVQTLLTNRQTQDVLADKAEQIQTEDPQGVAQGTGRDPAEEPVPDNAIINYQVSPDLPRYLSIPDIDVFARIKHSGLDNEGAVDSPTNIHDVSWYDQSAEPGKSIGASLLLGHVQGWSAPGVFKEIDQLEPGARFTVEKGNGDTLTYEVTRSEEFALDDVNMGQILSAEDSGEHDLKLMTCSGEYDAANESYLSRYVVYAKIVR